MDVIITLPSKVIQLIKEGKKHIELRKTCPVFFHPLENVIYIVEKGTNDIVGYMTIEQIIWTKNKYGILKDWSKDIAISLERIAFYIKDAKELYGLFISEYKSFDKPLSLNEYFHVKKEPQSFMYTFDYYR